MTKKEIIYNDLLRLLEAIYLDKDKLEDYSKTLIDEKENLFIEVVESIESETRSLIASKEAELIHENFIGLVSSLQSFKDNFDFEDTRISEILLLIELISKVNASEEEIDLTENIDTNIFTLVELQRSISARNFIYHDQENLKNSVVLLDMSNIIALSDYLDNHSVHIELYFHLISKVGEDNFLLNNSKYVLIDSSTDGKQSLIWASVSLHLVKDGNIIHQPYEYNLKPQILSTRKIISNVDYQQFNDTLIILSEYNHQKDILDKYLRIYHVIENFMYKFPLVQLERSHNGAVFSIRDFQKIYDNVKKSELYGINRLMKELCKEAYQNNIPATADSPEIAEELFSNFIHRKVVEIVSSGQLSILHFDQILKDLRVMKNEDDFLKHDDIRVNPLQIHKYFAIILYAVRNSIVHNRETEFHLTHNTLSNHSVVGNAYTKLLEKFLIPVIEEIVFYLILNSSNTMVWYQNSKLTLFDEN